MAHDPSVPHNFEITIEGTEGDTVRAQVRLTETIPAGGLTLDVVWDTAFGRVVSVTPWRNLGVFVTEALARAAGGAQPGH